MTEIDGLPALPPASLRKNNIKTGTGTKKQFFDVGAIRLLQAAPFPYGYKNSGFDPAASHNLWPLGQGGIKELAKPCLRVLQLPGTQGSHLEIQSYD
jgi:hypothetical protein